MSFGESARFHAAIRRVAHGGGCVEAEIRRRAIELLEKKSSALLRFKLDHDYGWDDGLICGGTIDMAIAPLPPPEVLDRVVDDIRCRRATSMDFTVQTETGT